MPSLEAVKTMGFLSQPLQGLLSHRRLHIRIEGRFGCHNRRRRGYHDARRRRCRQKGRRKRFGLNKPRQVVRNDDGSKGRRRLAFIAPGLHHLVKQPHLESVIITHSRLINDLDGFFGDGNRLDHGIAQQTHQIILGGSHGCGCLDNGIVATQQPHQIILYSRRFDWVGIAQQTSQVIFGSSHWCRGLDNRVVATQQTHQIILDYRRLGRRRFGQAQFSGGIGQVVDGGNRVHHRGRGLLGGIKFIEEGIEVVAIIYCRSGSGRLPKQVIEGIALLLDRQVNGGIAGSIGHVH